MNGLKKGGKGKQSAGQSRIPFFSRGAGEAGRAGLVSSVGGTSSCSNWRAGVAKARGGEGAGPRSNIAQVVLALGKAPELPKMRSRASPDGAWEADPRMWASGSFREDRAGAPPALRSIQWSLRRGTSLTGQTDRRTDRLSARRDSLPAPGPAGMLATRADIRTQTGVHLERGGGSEAPRECIWWSWPKSVHLASRVAVSPCCRPSLMFRQAGLTVCFYCLGRQPRLATGSCRWCTKPKPRGPWAAGLT